VRGIFLPKVFTVCLAIALSLSAPVWSWSQEGPAVSDEAKWGKLSLKGRAYFLSRDFENSGLQEALALGLWAIYESPECSGLSFGLGGYTSQPFLVDNPDHDGTGLLAQGQSGISVLGQAWLQGRLGSNALKLGRQILETPLINSYDVRMVPVALEGAAFTNHGLAELNVTAAHLTGIKPWTDTTFQSMSQAAGLSGSEEPVSLAGAVWRPAEGYSVQFWNYFCHQFVNMIYFQADATWPVGEGWSITAAAQAIDQRDVGRALGGAINANQWGLKLDLAGRGWVFHAAYTGAGPDHDIVNPWGSYPGWTSIMEEDNDRAGENSWLAGLTYDFSHAGIIGLSAYTMHTFSLTPDSGPHASPDQTEHDLTVDYLFQGSLKHLWLRVRGAYVDQDEDLGGEDYSDFRIIINYDFDLVG
jgi:hypothetical protein